MPVEIEVRSDTRAGSDIVRLARELKILGDGKTIVREFRKTLRQAVLPAQRSAKAAARGLPSSGRRSTGLRALTARATGTQVKMTGDPLVRVRVNRKTMGKQANLPRLMNDPSCWRHPVFGNRQKWVTQYSRRYWFDDPMRAAGPAIRREIERTLDEFERRLR